MTLKKPYLYFWITAILIIITGFFIYDQKLKTTINIKDTYYVFVNQFYCVFYNYVCGTTIVSPESNYR